LHGSLLSQAEMLALRPEKFGGFGLTGSNMMRYEFTHISEYLCDSPSEAADDREECSWWRM